MNVRQANYVNFEHEQKHFRLFVSRVGQLLAVTITDCPGSAKPYQISGFFFISSFLNGKVNHDVF